jgi:Chalcone isomerase-like
VAAEGTEFYISQLLAGKKERRSWRLGFADGKESQVNVRTLLAVATICCGLTGSVGMVQANDVAALTMPEVVTAHGRTLTLNGMGVGTKVFVRVYIIGFYLETKTTDARTAIAVNEAKRISLIMVRDVSRQQFVQAVEKGMVRNSGAAMPALRGRLDLLERALPALQKGNVLDFTYLPGTGTIVRGNGRELTIPGKDFADALLSIWLGPDAANRTLRQDLLRG